MANTRDRACQDSVKTRVARMERDGEQSLADLDAGLVLEALDTAGVVLIRGFEADLGDYEAFSRKFCDRFHRVAARDRLRDQEGDGFTARAPEVNFHLFAHSEGTYQPFKAPDLAFFYCTTAPESKGGEALLADGRPFLEYLPTSLVERFETQGAIFESLWEPDRWQAEFGIDSPAAFEAIAREHPGLDCAFEGDLMRYRCRRPVIDRDRAGQRVFANAILAHLPGVAHRRYRDQYIYTKSTNRVYFGDGEVLSDEVVDVLVDVQDAVAHSHRLECHDFLLIDNTRVMHGRRAMERNCPRVLLTRFGHLRQTLSGVGQA